jgi:hypothetical protein
MRFSANPAKAPRRLILSVRLTSRVDQVRRSLSRPLNARTRHLIIPRQQQSLPPSSRPHLRKKKGAFAPLTKSLLFEVVVIQAGWETFPLLNVPVVGDAGVAVGGIAVLPIGSRLGAFLARPVFRTAHDQTPSERSPMAPSKDPDLAKPSSVTQVSYSETGQRGSQPFLRQRKGTGTAYHVFNIGAPNTTAWWQENLDRGVITAGWDGDPGHRGEVVLRDMDLGLRQRPWICRCWHRRFPGHIFPAPHTSGEL